MPPSRPSAIGGSNVWKCCPVCRCVCRSCRRCAASTVLATRCSALSGVSATAGAETGPERLPGGLNPCAFACAPTFSGSHRSPPSSWSLFSRQTERAPIRCSAASMVDARQRMLRLLKRRSAGGRTPASIQRLTVRAETPQALAISSRLTTGSDGKRSSRVVGVSMPALLHGNGPAQEDSWCYRPPLTVVTVPVTTSALAQAPTGCALLLRLRAAAVEHP